MIGYRLQHNTTLFNLGKDFFWMTKQSFPYFMFLQCSSVLLLSGPCIIIYYLQSTETVLSGNNEIFLLIIQNVQLSLSDRIKSQLQCKFVMLKGDNNLKMVNWYKWQTQTDYRLPSVQRSVESHESLQWHFVFWNDFNLYFNGLMHIRRIQFWIQ